MRSVVIGVLVLASVAGAGRADAKPAAKPQPVQLSVGASHACASMSDGSARCWGDNSEGALGDGTTDERKAAVTPKVTDVVEVAAGENFTCARRADHSVWCWGWNPYGQLGSGAVGDAVPTPAPVVGLDDAIAIAAGEDHACAVRKGGTVACWGQNAYKDLGDGTTDAHPTPVAAKGLDHVVAISIGSATCARRDDGSVWCWGGNDGDLPAAVGGIGGAIDVAVGGLVDCVVLGDGTARCWGSSDSGQLGRGDAHDGEDGNQPMAPVAKLAHARAIAVEQDHACAIAGGRVLCWGASWGNDFPAACLKETRHRGGGDHGGGSPAQWKYCATPTAVSGIGKPVAIGVSRAMSCAITTAGKISCWGGEPARRFSPL